jgi:hypothetical protein
MDVSLPEYDIDIRGLGGRITRGKPRRLTTPDGRELVTGQKGGEFFSSQIRVVQYPQR